MSRHEQVVAAQVEHACIPDREKATPSLRLLLLCILPTATFASRSKRQERGRRLFRPAFDVDTEQTYFLYCIFCCLYKVKFLRVIALLKIRRG